ncbi:sensor protein KdpD [Clostridium pasteurianum DSM 525 = ATCC 6013]|uniref:histidine kinase n=1 Tax=Clostridium pasteurianum DSM 525 = ATCC 6013 TaxID=1262449 RepID=A0A0H3J5M3_CLOPA|nr:sensor histidine kinase KdpD [Clostridium pasteurianum]AJA49301.1 sensor protein KdpD [Clostridium pasteurianum DSM 525 = ATCC 6013]AJA53289.1 sensor protein KdpD [Clostridium pasteurianum DSM 525 = ATCC 6013]AOZ76479.1 histidine kinase [Clostridium pasteurianum DSM 525 = ATCC 6013]AOZ80276.1 histidine kinase [Clostridium pasteurianum]ELP58321.1 osmosensitive K+ channel histidine kinase [Clostridium pasteurianum DSM 525 = ATCC 6013]
MSHYERPSSDYFLSKIEKEEEKNKQGKLKIFFGYAAGVGKTYEMLREAQEIKKSGEDIVIGYIEPHARPETMALTEGLESIENKIIKYKGSTFKEFDIDKALIRKPKIILVDELAHTNARGQRNRKRWQDIQELLAAGIDVYTTVNVQHIESLNDVVENITHVSVRETIPDKIFDDAEKVEIVDIEPDELLNRFNEGKIYKMEQVKRALLNFFTRNNLYALREISLRRIADRVNYEVESERLAKREITVIPTSEQILACISPSPSSAKVIRTAARMAENYHSKFIVLYISTSKSENLSEQDKKRLNFNFNLAEKLGGEVVQLYGDNIVEQIIQYAEFRNITKLVIGKNYKRSSKIFHFYAKDVVDKLMDSNAYIDVYVIPNSLYKKKREKVVLKLNEWSNLSLREIVEAAIIIGIVTGIASIFEYMGFNDTNAIMIFILGVIIVYMKTTGYLIGIISSIFVVLMFNFLFTDPKYSFKLYDKNYLTTFIMMLTVAFIVGSLTNKIQKEASNSYNREKRTQTLYMVSSKLLSAVGTSEVISIGIKYISRLINRTIIGYLPEGNKLSTNFVYNRDKDENKNLFLNKEEDAAAYWSYLNGKEAGNGTDTFYGAKGYYMPIKVQNKVLGVIGVSCLQGFLEPEQKFIVQTITGQIAIAIDREILSSQQEKSKVQIERERLRSNLLRSISHDLRSPLAGIKGAISTILENGKFISEKTKEDLLNGIYDDTEWLIRLVENLLSMTKFDEGNMEIKKNMELVEEVVSEAVQRSSKYFKNHKIKVSVPENIIMVSMDGNLIEQVIINLLDNAVKFSPKESVIEIKVYEKDDDVIFQVIDNGTGIDEKILSNIFDRFFTNGSKISDSRRGIGLGLAICKSIVEAHGGKITAANRKEGGAVFSFNIPKA